jgi:hypothetical protein
LEEIKTRESEWKKFAAVTRDYTKKLNIRYTHGGSAHAQEENLLNKPLSVEYNFLHQLFKQLFVLLCFHHQSTELISVTSK